MTVERSPMRMLAIKQFSESFGDLLGSRASVGDSERLMIEHVYEQLFFFESKTKEAWHRRVRAAYHFLDYGSLENPKGVAERFLNCGELMGMALNSAIDMKRESRETEDSNGEATIRRKLAYYKDLLEGAYRVLVAPVVYAFGRVMRNPDLDFVPASDGKAKLHVLPKIERLLVYPQNQLGQGVNTHIRNAYAHANYRILNEESVELWDPLPQKKNKPPKTWGPETWHVDKLDELSDDLELTNLALIHAITIYAINNRFLISARGWKKTLSRPPLTERELRQSVEHVAGELGFEPKSFAFENARIQIHFDTQYPGISQNEEIFMGGGKWGRRLIQKVEYVDVRIIEQLLGLFQKTNSYWEGYLSARIIVADPKGQLIGEIELDVKTIPQLEGPSKMPVANARRLLTFDSIGDAKMNVRIPHSPVDA